TIGAIVGFYVKYCGDEFSNSIRWSRTGGFYEMIALYRNSDGGLSIRSRTIMILMIFASLCTLFVTIPLGESISRTKRNANSASQGVFSRQPMPADPSEWTIAYMEADAAMAGTIALLISDSGFNPSPSPWLVYTPRTYPYEAHCTEARAVEYKTPIGMPFFASPPPTTTASWSPLGLMFEPIFYAYKGNLCLFKSPAATYLYDIAKEGLTSLPSTDTTRYQFGSSNSFVLAVTLIKFAVNHMVDFDKVIALIMDDPPNLHLLKTMHTVIDNGAFTSATNSSIVVFLINRKESSVYHMPLGLRDMATYSAAHLLKATTDATKYFASLGHNFVLDNDMDDESRRLYVLYDTVELMDAFEVTTTLLIVLGCAVVVCSAIWGFSETKYPAVFNGSLYKLINQEIKSKEMETSMIMNFRQDPLAFNDYREIPYLDELPRSPLQEVPAVVVNIEPT
ncbi:hypothetical protein BGZ95_003191, partial [Linnemannia exigua]